MSRRGQITMTDAELAAFLDEQRVVTCATLGPNGRPHLMPLWFCLLDGRIAGWTYGRSQKAVNLRRDPRATLQLEAGDTYHQLRGVMYEADVELREDPDAVTDLGHTLMRRYAGGAEVPRDMIAAQAPKRIGLVFHPTRTVTWDHRKLGGTY